MIKLKVEHLPFHGCYGRLDEMKTPDRVTTSYDVDTNQVIDLEKFKIKILSINDNFVKLVVFDNQGVKDDESVDTKNEESELSLEFNLTHKIYLNVMDCMEDWDLTFLK